MDEIINEGMRINKLIKTSEEYAWYQRSKNKLNEHPELSAQLKEYRKRNHELQTIRDMNPYDEVVALVREYDELLHNSYVSDFLKAEECICRMLKKVYIQIAEGLEFDYLDE